MPSTSLATKTYNSLFTTDRVDGDDRLGQDLDLSMDSATGSTRDHTSAQPTTSSGVAGYAEPSSKARPNSNLDLSQYVGLGSLLFDIGHATFLSEEWAEVNTEPLPMVSSGHDIQLGLTRLFQLSWIRIFAKRSTVNPEYASARIFLLPDDVARSVLPRSDKKARTALRALMLTVDKTSEAWLGKTCQKHGYPTYTPEISNEDSLFYVFNTLKSPQPDLRSIDDEYAAESVNDILVDSLRQQGLKTDMYPYQRRSAATMISRETTPGASIDPRLESLESPNGETFYFDRYAGHVLNDKVTFADVRGGILAETMGYGKTLISLAVILATKNTMPVVPPEHLVHVKTKSDGAGCRSLGEMAAASIARHNLPWKNIFADLHRSGHYHDTSEKLLRDAIGSYEIHTEVKNRRQTGTVVKHIQLLSTTLVIVPPNLLSQWKSEIAKHLSEDAMSIFVADDVGCDLPETSLLCNYDMILMSRTRFEGETTKPGQGSGENVRCRCHVAKRFCWEHSYESPLLNSHFLRLIVDEGQGFVSDSVTHASHGLQNLRVDRKWIVSGTPTSSMIGAEVDLAAEENYDEKLDDASASFGESADTVTSLVESDVVPRSSLCTSTTKYPTTTVQKTLLKRQKVVGFKEEKKSIERLGFIVKRFLGVKPWANTVADGDVADWKLHVVPSSSGGRKLLSLRNLLQSLVVRHRIEDIEVDLKLPPLHNKVVSLEPAFVDKLSINLFILMLAANAITSERTDQDYMFHPTNRRNLEALIKNMRSSAFFWSGFTEHDIFETCRVSEKYMEEHVMVAEDRKLLEDAVVVGRTALSSSAWRAFSESGELGFYIRNFPREADLAWTLCPSSIDDCSLLGATRLLDAMHLVEKNIYASDPLQPITKEPPSVGIKSMSASTPKKNSPKRADARDNAAEPGKGIPRSSLQDPFKLSNGKLVGRNTNNASPLKSSTAKHLASTSGTSTTAASILKRSTDSKPPIPQAYKELVLPQLVGTSSAKLSYLLDKIVALHADEKILVFYEGDHIAYYCAQALEILGIPHFIYPAGLSLKLRAEYQTKFNEDSVERVMLMDLKQAALGLHIASASRVFFVNPVWQPHIEAQAIKRAHRIGQSRPVFVETLVLQGTFEDKILERRRSMTTQEQQNASKSLLDDTTMTDTIKKMTVIPLTDKVESGMESQYAPLKSPQQIFARSITTSYTATELDAFVSSQAKRKWSTDGSTQHTTAFRTSDNSHSPSKAKDSTDVRKKKRRLMFADEVMDRDDMAATGTDVDGELALGERKANDYLSYVPDQRTVVDDLLGHGLESDGHARNVDPVDTIRSPRPKDTGDDVF
jgi:SNF2 family DNA or RNA helicase